MCVQGGLLWADRARLYSSFHLPAQVRVTSCRHRANSRDPRPLGEVPGVQVPAIPQHGKGANCLDRPQDNMPPLPSPLAPQEKILWPPSHPTGISLSHLEASSAWTRKLKHLAPFTFLSLHLPYFSPGNPLLKCSVLLFGEVRCSNVFVFSAMSYSHLRLSTEEV